MRKNAAALRALPFPGKTVAYEKRRCCNEHAQNGHRTAARHALLLKLTVDIGRDHQSIRRRDEACRHELAEGDNEDHQPPGKNAARDHRKRDAPEHIRRRTAEDPSRLQEAVVDLGKGGGHILHRVGKIQNHVGQHHDPDRVINPILGLGATFALAILTSFQSYDPHSMCASYKKNQYVHKNKGAFVTIEKSVLMYDMELWPQADYAGTSVSRIAYKVTLWENGEA